MSDHLYLLLGACACLSLLIAGLLVTGIFLLLRRAKSSEPNEQPQVLKDQSGYWWYQDQATAVWFIWNGQTWRKVPGASPRIIPSQPPLTPASRARPPLPCLASLLTTALVAVFVLGGITLVAYNFFPAYHIIPEEGDWIRILKMVGGGLLLAVFGLFMLNRGFRTLLAQGKQKSGCSHILNGLGQLFFALFFLTAGLALIAIAFFQEILPWLGI